MLLAPAATGEHHDPERAQASGANHARHPRHSLGRPAVGHHHHAVGNGPHELGVVLDQDERDAALAHPPEDLREPRQVGGARAGGRLVEQQQPGPRGQRRSEHQQPPLEAVERLGTLGRDRLEPDRPQRLERLAARASRLRPGLRCRRDRPERPAVGRVQRRPDERALERGQAAEGRRSLQGAHHAGVRARLGPGRPGTAVDEDLARVEREHAAERTERGRLPRPVRTDQRDRLAGRDVEVETVERANAAVGLRQAAGGERGRAPRRRLADRGQRQRPRRGGAAQISGISPSPPSPSTASRSTR